MTGTPNVGINFTDPARFIPITTGGASVLVVATSNTTNKSDGTQTFWNYISNRGALTAQVMSVNTFYTVLNATATTKGEVLSIGGPRMSAAGTITFRITRDGGASATITVSVSANGRAFLVSSAIYADTTPQKEFTNNFKFNGSKSTIIGLTASGAYLPPIEVAKSRGIPLFDFSRSLLVEIATSALITSTGSADIKTGVMYRTLQTI